jgi:hypothetical protein
MPECPRCHQPVETQAISCPYCRTVLKAHGHPGIPLYRATGSEPLCLTCAYHEDDTCTFPQRPDATDCTMYRDRNWQQALAPPRHSTGFSIQNWLKRNLVWLALIGLILLSLLLTLMQ